MMIDFNRLNQLQTKLFALIDREISRVGHHKSYEGALSYHMGGRFSKEQAHWELDCYVCPVISGRSWTFSSLDELEQMLNDWEAVGFDNENEQYIYPKEVMYGE